MLHFYFLCKRDLERYHLACQNSDTDTTRTVKIIPSENAPWCIGFLTNMVKSSRNVNYAVSAIFTAKLKGISLIGFFRSVFQTGDATLSCIATLPCNLINIYFVENDYCQQ